MAALRDQPYLPLYVDKFANDEKLRYCSASANGVHIRLMCLMHKTKSGIYGTLELKKEYKKEIKTSFADTFAQANTQANGEQLAEDVAAHLAEVLADYFAKQLATQMPYSLEVIHSGLTELNENEVIYFDHFCICQNGMMKQGDISDKRSSAGKKGFLAKGRSGLPAKKKVNETPVFTKNVDGDFAEGFASAKVSANTTTTTTIKNTIKSTKDIGGIGYKRGGTGEKEIGGKRIPPKSDKKQTKVTDSKIEIDMIEKEYEVGEFLNVYFASPKYSMVRERLAMSNYMDLGVLRLWAEAFNEYLLSSGQDLNEEGKTIKLESDWAKHFKFWLQKQDLKQNPKKHNENKKEEYEAKSKSASQNGNRKNGQQPFDLRSAVGQLNMLPD